MLEQRVVNIARDRDTLLEFHCRINYESETPWARRGTYKAYRAKWLSTSQPEVFLSHLGRSLEDERTIAEIWEEEGATIGYVWVTFTDLQDYDVTIAEVMDIAVSSDHQRRGVGLKMFEHVERNARDRGATLLRSDTGIENVASQRLHEKLSFKPYRVQYEKVLEYEDPVEI